MKQGTVSVLVGCHSVIHSVLVVISWWKLYGRFPKLWQMICIFLHDVGHWGKNYLDDYEEKKRHWELGAKIAKKIFGQKGYNLIAGHDIHSGVDKSLLYKPDKYSWYIAPTWWLWCNILFERKLKRSGLNWMQSIRLWQKSVKENIETGKYESNHVLYLRLMRAKNGRE